MALAKPVALAKLLDVGKTLIVLDARVPGVVVPDLHASDPMLLLNLSWRFGGADLKLTSWGVEATLHFSEIGEFRCKVPWRAIYLMRQPLHTAFVWEEDAPDEALIVSVAASDPEAIRIVPPPPARTTAPTAPESREALKMDVNKALPTFPRHGHLQRIK